jgi:putative ABC transport system permease protein
MYEDLRLGARLLVRAPGFSMLAILALAIGIGANTAIFSVVNTLLIQPLPYPQADRLAMVWEHNLVRDRQRNVVGPANYLFWRDLQTSFEDLAAVSMRVNATLTDGEPEMVWAQSATTGFFPLMGVRPAMGRTFEPDDARPGAAVAVITDRLWKRRFGAAPDILDRTARLNGTPYSIVGVMPEGFSFLDRTVDLWVPMPLTDAARTPRGRSLTVVGRLRQGVTPDRAQQDMARVHAELTRMFPDFNTGWTAQVIPLREELAGDVRPALLILAGAVGLVLLIACANVASLLMTRATSRQCEFAVRSALGASRGRLVRQLLVESGLLAAAGGAAGMLVAWWSVHLLRVAIAERLPVARLDAVSVDGWVLAFTAVISLTSGLLFGLFPAFTASATRVAEALKQGGRTGAAGHGNRARGTLVIVEIALALVLLVGAGLLIRSFATLMTVDPGFRADRILTMRVNLAGAEYGEGPARVRFMERLIGRLQSLPGVEAAGAVSFLPLTGLAAATSYEVVGAPPPAAGEAPVTDVRVATWGYFEALDVPLLRGRLFDDGSPHDASGRIVISESLARRHWPTEDPIGKRLRISWSDVQDDEVIGVVGDVRHAGLEAAPRATIYWPYARFPYNGMTLTLRASQDPDALTRPAIAALRSIDPMLAATSIRTLDGVVGDSVAERRVTMLLLAVFAAAALALAAVGIYGVIAYGVTLRTREFGVRMALGARPADVRWIVVRSVLLLASAGITLGTAGAYVLTRFMAGMLYGVPRTDPLTFLSVAAGLVGVALLASLVPALRATRLDPATALRGE